jgi:hypothetical protein|tara:strand:- start:96 stop:674 length:579 start_codon:yes stop_codon:yes gene_type:complete
LAEIKFHPDDRVMSGFEVVKDGGLMVLGLLFFEGMFYAMYLEGEVLMSLLCGVPLGLMAIAIAFQCVMHFLGFGKMVIYNGTMILRTPRSGEVGKSFFAPLARVVLAPMAKMAMRSMDEDGDGRLSFEEILEDMGVVSKSEYAEVRRAFDLYDEDGDGFLSLKELEGFLTHSEDNWAEVEEKPGNWWSEDGN